MELESKMASQSEKSKVTLFICETEETKQAKEKRERE